jgi:hypothetical protein
VAPGASDGDQAIPLYRSRGAVRTKRQVAAKDRTPPSVAAIAHRLAGCWDRRTVSEGTKGLITSEVTKRRVTLRRDGVPDRTAWLVMKRSPGEQPTYWYAISHAPLSSRVSLFGW